MAEPAHAPRPAPELSAWRSVAWRLRQSPLTLIGLLVVLAIVVVIILAPQLAGADPLKANLAQRLKPPMPGHPFGTDEVGRDLFARVLFGARLSVGTGLAVVGVAATFGILLGSVTGYIGGRFDLLMMRILDVILAFPSMVLAMALAAALKPDLWSAMAAVAFVKIPVYVRLVRGQALAVREQAFVKAARTFGASPLRIILRHIVPGVLSVVTVQASLGVGEAILTTASLSFLGLGAQPPAPEWGAMVSVGRQYILDQWWYATFPGIAIFVTTMAFNLVGDGVRDLLDPHGRH